MRKQLERARVEKRPVEIIYLKKDGSISQRVIMVCDVNNTYIKAYCLKKKQPRIFKLDSILATSLWKDRKKYA
ncbi:MAG TPA: WYL domain-containing protein [Niallia sp.]|nr:WYL domain-containing protein [Niallia sp.]